MVDNEATAYDVTGPLDLNSKEQNGPDTLAALRYPSVGEARAQIAACRDGSLPLEPCQLVSQNKVEPLLREVAEASNVTVRYGCELVDFRQDDSGVSVRARRADGAEERRGDSLPDASDAIAARVTGQADV